MSINNTFAALVGLTFAFLSSAATQADIVWNVTFDDVVNSTGVGFDDVTHGATRRATFNSVLGYINSAVDEGGIGDIHVQNSQTDGGGFLASAGPFFATGPNGYQNGSLFTHATTGSDPFGGVADANVTFDFGYNWNNGLGGPGGSQFDMFSVALHEMTHAMGFLSLTTPSGVSAISGTDPGVFSVYDSFLQRGDGTPLFGPGGDFLGTAPDLISGDVFFTGANAMAAYGGAVPVYAPGAFASGSSISHITPGDAVMQFSIGPGTLRRSYSAAELGILQDIGWNLAAVPEPNSLLFVMTILGLAAMRRRSR